MNFFQPRPAPVVPLPVIRPITLDDYMEGRENDQRYVHQWTFQIRDNAIELLRRVNQVLIVFGKPRHVNSGWRPPAINAAVKGAAGSRHMTGQAIDLGDDDRALRAWLQFDRKTMLIGNLIALKTLVDVGLWMEHPDYTEKPSGLWIHWQSVPPGSGHRVFIP